MKASNYLKPEILVPLVLGTLILGTLGWMAVKLYDLNGQFSGMNSTVNDTRDRVNRIANALPDLQVFIAQEQINKPFGLAIVTNRPYATPSGHWVAVINVFDFESQVRSTYAVDLDNANDATEVYALLGSASSNDLHALSFSEYGSWSAQLQQSVAVPSYVMPTTSFSVSNSTPTYDDWLDAWASTQMTLIDRGPLAPNLDTWPKLMSEMHNNPDIYNVTYTP